jgi:Flp pilus assembly protein TadG
MRSGPSRLRGFLTDTGGVSAVEFTLVFPVLMTMMLGGGQLSLYIDASRKVEQVATSASEMISQAVPPVGGDGSASVNAVDLNFSYDSALVIFPYVMTDAKQRNLPWRQVITVSFAGISFVPVQGTDCTGQADQSACYTAQVDWTSTGTSTSNYRPCSPAQGVTADTASTDRTLLPRSVFGAGSIIAVDVSYTFYPTFGSNLINPVTISRSVFVQPRYATKITFDATKSDGIATTCPH